MNINLQSINVYSFIDLKNNLYNYSFFHSTILINLTLLFTSILVFPQNQGLLNLSNFKIDRITTEQGLSQSTVECIFRDSRGFMWFGTEEGLNKFDGYKFTVYKNNHRDTTSINSEAVFSIHEDSQGIIWIGTIDGGLNRFDRNTEIFSAYKNDPENSNSISDNKVNIIFESKNLPGVLWLGTENGGLNRFEISSGKFTRYLHDTTSTNSISSNRVFSIIESKAYPGILWIATHNGLNKFDYTNNTFKHYKQSKQDKNSLSDNSIWTIYELPWLPGVIWIGTKNGLNSFEIGTETFTHFFHNPVSSNSLSHNEVTSLQGSPEEPGVLYAGTRGGGLNKLIISFDKSEEKILFKNINYIHLKNEPGNNSSLSSDYVFSLFEDQNQPGVLWVGTFDSGITKIYKSKKKFNTYRNNPDDKNSLVNNVVWCIFEDSRNRIWVGTHEGMSEITRNIGSKTHFKNYVHSDINQNTIGGNIVTSITEVPPGSEILWIGTYGGGLTKLNQFGSKDRPIQFTHLKNNPADPNTISSNSVLTLCPSKYDNNILWIGTTRGGLNRYSISENLFSSYKNDPQNLNTISSNTVQVIWESINSLDVLWIGTIGGGLNKFNKSKQTFESFRFDANNSNSISSDIVLSLYQSQSDPDILWIGTAEGGLNKLNIKTEKFTVYTTDNGLPNNIINAITEDNDGYLWLSTNRGLSRFDPKNNSFRNYDVHDGLQDNEFNGGAFFKSSTGEIFFGGMNGFNSFFPSEILDNPNIPPIVITDFKIFNRSVLLRKNNSEIPADYDLIYLDKTISETELLTLSYKHNFFSFDFAALDFAAPNKNTYAYKLEGFDADWIYSGNRRYASYTNLDPGEYIFRVKGANNDGVWNDDGTFVKIIITPPFWKTWWFLTIFWSIVVVTVLVTARYVTTRKLKKQIEKLEREREMEKERTRISRDMHDEVGSSLTEIAIISEIVKKNINKPEEVVGHLNNISSQIAEIIDNISQIIWAINPKNDPLENLISYIRQFGKNYLGKAGVKCRFLVEEKLPDFHLSAEVRRNVFLVFKEALNNVVKHSGANEVIAKIDILDSKMALEIIDNGKGIEKKNGFGNGLNNMQRRVEEINGEFNLSSEVGNGTIIKLTVPLYK